MEKINNRLKMKIEVYGADWCIDCKNAKNFFDSKEIKYEYIDITDNNEAIAFVEKINNGKRVIPTLIVNGKSFTNPDIYTLIRIIEENM